MDQTAELLSTAQAARMLDRSTDRVRQLVRAGRLPAQMTPLGRLYDRRDVERLAAQRGGTDPEAA